MSTSGRKRKQQLKPRQDVHRSPMKRQSLDVKTEPLLANSYPLADYDCVDVKPDLTELQLQLSVAPPTAASATTTTSAADTAEDIKTDQDLQQSDSDDDGYSEIHFGTRDVYCQDELDDYDAEWSVQQTTRRLIFKFTTPNQQTGLKNVRKSACPMHYFNQLLGNRVEFFAQLASNCNARNATLAANGEELETFVGLCLLICDVKLPQLSDYWSNNMFHGFVGYALKMKLQRFIELLQSLNFDQLAGNTNTTHVGGDAGKLINFFNARMSELYVCGQPLVLNEPIIHWKGRFNYQNELPDRYRSNALMLHLLSEQSGLIVRIMPEFVEQQLARNSRQLVVQRSQLALQLLQDHLKLGHSVYVCKYYGSYGLAHELSKLGTYCSGLLDRNRYGNSKALVHQQLTSNSISTRYATVTPLMMAKWRRREKCVYFYSSDCLAIYAKEMSMQKINARPKLIQQLDFHLRPTQSTRQQLINYQPACSGLQRQQQLIVYLLNMVMFNAHLLYMANAQPSRGFSSAQDATKLKTYAEFRVAIIKSLLKEDTVGAVPRTTENQPVTPTNITTITAKSKPVKTPPSVRAVPEFKLMEVKHELVPINSSQPMTTTTTQRVRKNCQHCNKGGMLQFTKFMCNLCPNNPGLCQDPCFQLWHEQLKDQP
ncbi:uncharacterized protein LOC133836378 [Drosophila sulfurigaster albostrigata]|uniref:uncharacterized protein LOC133836378 n=1 Tax=Drosophila sulfurigaster albostrigata TaxID=89887 RepID=UPI002D21A627|nr:uncharacterized protein LOC133836378 [Drosophila sulfurigaster albostrigata]